jgi:transcription elongation factor/antiterminator RfaH
MVSESPRRWYLVRTLAGRELLAEGQLNNQGFETFLPKRAKTVRHARKLSTVLAGYFPSYLFVALDLGRDRWRSVNGTVCVSHLVAFGDRPSPVPGGIVEALIEASDHRGVVALGPDFEVGQRVRIVAGPFADQLATIDRLDDAGRVRLLLDIVGGQLPVQTVRASLAEVN